MAEKIISDAVDVAAYTSEQLEWLCKELSDPHVPEEIRGEFTLALERLEEATAVFADVCAILEGLAAPVYAA